MLEGATREKFFLLLYKELTKKLLGQQAVYYRCHLAFMILIWTKDIEEF